MAEKEALYDAIRQMKDRYCTMIKNGGKRSVVQCYKAEERSVLYNDLKRRKKKYCTML